MLEDASWTFGRDSAQQLTAGLAVCAYGLIPPDSTCVVPIGDGRTLVEGAGLMSVLVHGRHCGIACGVQH